MIPLEDPGSETKLGEENPRKRQSSFSFHSSSAASTTESTKMTEEGDNEPKRIRFQQTSTVKGKKMQINLTLIRLI